MERERESRLPLARNYKRNETQKCKCLCARSSLLLWGAVASVVDDRCHTGGGRQNGDMWEWEQAGNRTRANMPHTHRKANPITACANASLKAFQLPTLQLINCYRHTACFFCVYVHM